MAETATIKHINAELLPEDSKPKDVGRKVFWILGEVLGYKESQGLPAKWIKGYDLSKNKHWRTKNSAKPLVSANLIGAHRNRVVNVLTNNNPIFNVTRFADENVASDDQITMVLRTAENWWREQEQQSIFEDSVLNGETYGCTIEKVVFNPELEYGLGEVETEIIEPFHFGTFPVKTKDVQKCDAVLHFRPMSLREVRRMWPDSADDVKADKEYIAKLQDTRKEMAGGKGKGSDFFGSIAGIVKHFMNDAGAEGGDEEDEVLVVECWVKDRTEVSETTLVLTDDGMPMEEVISQPKYQGFIRRVICCNGGEVVLEDKSNPSINPELKDELAQQTYLYDKFPFSRAPSNKDNICPWGLADFEQLEGLQAEINKSLSQFTLLKDRASRMKIINPKTSGVPNDHFTNAPGILNPTNSMEAQGIKYMSPPEIPADLLEGLKLYKDFFYTVSGAFELENAQTPGRQVVAYKAIAELVEQAKTMEQGKIRNYSRLIRDRGRMYLSHAQNWYTEERFISYEEGDEKLTSSVTGHGLIVPAKLTVVSGSTMPRSEIQKREEALNLFDKGAIDNEALLSALDWDGKKDVLARMKQGPLGQLAEVLGAMGAPEQFSQFVMQIGQMEQKEIEQLMKSDQMPSLEQLLQPDQEQPTDPMATEETRKIGAEIEKIIAEAQLVYEKIKTEQVEQRVRAEGVGLDWENLKLEKFKAMMDAANKKYEHEADKMGLSKAANKTSQGSYRESGMKSNNVKQDGK